MDSALSSMFNLYQFPTGRRLFALRLVAPLAKKMGQDPIAAQADRAIAHDETTLALEAKWSGARAQAPAASEAALWDQRLDRAVAGMYAVISAIAEAMPAQSKQGKAALRLREEFFPAGVTEIIHATHPEEAERVDAMVRQLRDRYIPEVQALGLDEMLAGIESNNREFRKAIANKPARPSYDEVRAAQAKGQDMLLQVVAMTLGAYPSMGSHDVARRAKLLGPILAQHEAIAAYRKRRRAVPDVNPTTGEPAGVAESTSEPQDDLPGGLD